nr:MAG TPA: hypothetical protein [Caudoviricetes sp.]
MQAAQPSDGHRKSCAPKPQPGTTPGGAGTAEKARPDCPGSGAAAAARGSLRRISAAGRAQQESPRTQMHIF